MNLSFKDLLFRDGTAQSQRTLKSLNPEYARIDERSFKDMVELAQRLAKEVDFYEVDSDSPQDLKAVGDWSPFFEGNTDEMIAFMQRPDLFAKDVAKLEKLGRPPLVLYLTFLALLEHPKKELNKLTQRHLEFYYEKALQLVQKSPVADQVNVMIKLYEGIHNYKLTAGTLLNAGPDSEGKQIIYKTDRDLIVNQAQVEHVQTIHIEKKIITIKEAHRLNREEPDRGFMGMMQLALGEPEPGNSLPALPEGIADLEALFANLSSNEREVVDKAKDYMENSLYMPLDDFTLLMETKKKDDDTSQIVSFDEWETVYALLTTAYEEKQYAKRKNQLKEIHTQKGFDAMFQAALGESQLGGKLQPFPEGAETLEQLNQFLQEEGTDNRKNAEYYLKEYLFLTPENFARILEIKHEPKASSSEWKQVYTWLQRAEHQKKNLPAPIAEKDVWHNVYAAKDATKNIFRADYEPEGSHSRWKTFGQPVEGQKEPTTTVGQLGVAIASPLLNLKEGKRRISMTVALRKGSFDEETLKGMVAFPPNVTPKRITEQLPFFFQLSVGKEWKDLLVAEARFGTCITDEPGEVYQGTLNTSKTVLTKTSGSNFETGDTNGFIRWTDGTVYQITSVVGPTQVNLRAYGTITTVETSSQTSKKEDPYKDIRKYRPGGAYNKALQFVFLLDEKYDPVAIELDEELDLPLASSQPHPWPVLKMMLKNLPSQDVKLTEMGLYQRYHGLVVEQVNLTVVVDEIREFVMRNDSGSLDPQSPFQPFGGTPELGTSFYFSHPEIAQKRLDSLTLNLQWMGAPQKLSDHYANYWKVEKDDPNLKIDSYPIKANGDFQTQVTLYDNHTFLNLESQSLFPESNAQEAYPLTLRRIPRLIQKNYPGYSYKEDTKVFDEVGNVLDWNRYFKCELASADFQHSIYNELTYQKATSTKDAIKALRLNEAYTPKIKTMNLGYTASTDIDLKQYNSSKAVDQVFHIHPFGYKTITPIQLEDSEQGYTLLPSYANEGELYIGLKGLAPSQNLSLLMQMAEGSMEAETDKPEVEWSYLSNNLWQPLKGRILEDSTNDLTNTGLILFDIPEEANKGNTLLHKEHHWLRASVEKYAGGVCDAIAIHTQAVRATLQGKDNADSHFEAPLPPYTIQGTNDILGEIEAVKQPYTSERGKPREKALNFYTRVSERLRHKDRALTPWDYERMVLEQFPNIYKVKCLFSHLTGVNDTIGKVEVIVVPNIRGKLPSNPFKPKVPNDVLEEIQTYLQAHTSPFVEICVKNPLYQPVKVRFGVSFKPGYNQAYYSRQIDEELKRFLAPWAYDDYSEIVLGNTIYSNAIVNFLEERPYVDFVSNIKLFQSEDGIYFKDVQELLKLDEYAASATRSDAILVSAREHKIDLITTTVFEETKSTSGIGYMRVELDYKVAEEGGAIVADVSDNAQPLNGLGYMQIGLDFKVS